MKLLGTPISKSLDNRLNFLECPRNEALFRSSSLLDVVRPVPTKSKTHYYVSVVDKRYRVKRELWRKLKTLEAGGQSLGTELGPKQYVQNTPVDLSYFPKAEKGKVPSFMKHIVPPCLIRGPKQYVQNTPVDLSYFPKAEKGKVPSFMAHIVPSCLIR